MQATRLSVMCTHPLGFQSSWDNLLTWLFLRNACGSLILLFNCFICFHVEIRQVPNTTLTLSFPFFQTHLFTLGSRLTGPKYTGEDILVVEREMQDNKPKPRGGLNLRSQHTFVSVLLAKNSDQAKHNKNTQENILCF